MKTNTTPILIDDGEIVEAEDDDEEEEETEQDDEEAEAEDEAERKASRISFQNFSSHFRWWRWRINWTSFFL